MTNLANLLASLALTVVVEPYTRGRRLERRVRAAWETACVRDGVAPPRFGARELDLFGLAALVGPAAPSEETLDEVAEGPENDRGDQR